MFLHWFIVATLSNNPQCNGVLESFNIWLQSTLLRICLLREHNYIHLSLLCVDPSPTCTTMTSIYPCFCHFSIHYIDLCFIKAYVLRRKWSTSMTLLSRFLAFYWFQFIDLHGHTCLSIQIALHQAVCLSSQDYRILSPKPVYFCKQMTILYSLCSSNNSNYCRFDHNLFSIGFDCGHR